MACLWALSLGVVMLLAAAGAALTVRLAGPSAIPALLAGCGAALVGALLGAVPLSRLGRDTGSTPKAWGSATLVRLVTTLALALALVAGTDLMPGALLVWAALGYLALLAVEAAWAVKVVRHEDSDRLWGSR